MVNGLIQIDRQTSDPEVMHHEPLDYEQTWEDEKFFVFKCYDHDARTVYIKIDKDTMLETVLGDVNLISLRRPLPQEGK